MSRADRSRPEIVAVHPVDDRNEVLSVDGGDGSYRRRPCGGCPWRVDQAGSFPPGAFAVSARTAYDLATSAFACHEAGADRPKTCAGFLLRGATHNLSVRLRRIDLDAVSDGGHELHPGYVSMAVANGVPPDHPSLRPCRLSPHEEAISHVSG